MDNGLILKEWDVSTIEDYLSYDLGFGILLSTGIPSSIAGLPMKHIFNIIGENRRGNIRIVANRMTNGGIDITFYEE